MADEHHTSPIVCRSCKSFSAERERDCIKITTVSPTDL